MLVLSRKLGESVIIGNQVKVTVLAVHGNQVRVGIEAPREVSVHRQEVYKRITGTKPYDKEPDSGSNSAYISEH